MSVHSLRVWSAQAGPSRLKPLVQCAPRPGHSRHSLSSTQPRRSYASKKSSETETAETHANPSTNDDGSSHPDSLQARLIQALEQKYQPPSLPKRPPDQQFRASSSAQPPLPKEDISPQLQPRDIPQVQASSHIDTSSPTDVQEAVSAAVAATLADAEEHGAAQAAALELEAPEEGAQATPLVEQRMGTHEDGRILPKTPADKPWLAVYTRPSHAGSKPGDASTPSVYYGKYLRTRAKGGLKTTSERLKDLGVNTANLPLDDMRAMRAVKEGIRRFERAGRMWGAKRRAWEYGSRKLSEAELTELQAELEAEAKKAQEAAQERAKRGEVDDDHRTFLGRNAPDFLSQGRAAGSSGMTGGGGGRDGASAGSTIRRWMSVADERIEAARAAGFFKENKLRGKPLVSEVHELNPFLGREEFIMNRIVKRQGAAPPWVELNNTFHSNLTAFRAKLVESLSRRAVRDLTRSGRLVSSMAPNTGSGGTDSQRREYFLSLARSYRDPEWESMERGYHNAAVKDLNDTLRRHNAISPPSAKKSYVVREEELQRCYSDSITAIADGLEDTWAEVTGKKPRLNNAGLTIGRGSQTYDIWGNAIETSPRPSEGQSGWSLWDAFSGNKEADGSAHSGGSGAGGKDKEDRVNNAGFREPGGSSNEQKGLLRRILAFLATTPTERGSESRK